MEAAVAAELQRLTGHSDMQRERFLIELACTPCVNRAGPFMICL